MTTTSLLVYRECNGSEVEIEATIAGHVEPYVPAKTYGSTADCYPAEGGYVEDIEVLGFELTEPAPGFAWDSQLTEHEEEAAGEALAEAADDRY